MTDERPASPTTAPAEASDAPDRSVPAGNMVVTLLAAWLLPGAGHFLLGRRARGFAFLLIVLTSLAIGMALEGNLYSIVPNRPLTVLATLACMGLGLPYFLLRFGLDYQGEIVSAGYEYGTAFILTAGLMNILLILDCMDISSGQKR